MKIFFLFLCFFPILVSCQKKEPARGSQFNHPSFAEIQSFIQKEKGTRDLGIQQIGVERFHLKETKIFNDNKAGPDEQSFQALYDLNLEGINGSYKSKAVLVSDDNTNWKMNKLTVMDEADSAGKHYETIREWNNGDSLSGYNFTVKITH